MSNGRPGMGRKGSVVAVFALWGCVNQSGPAPAIVSDDRAAELAKATACVERGDLAMQKGDLEQAHDFYRCAVERRARFMLDSQKDLIEGRWRLASVLESACRLDEARAELERVKMGARPSPALAAWGAEGMMALAGHAWLSGHRSEAVRLFRVVANDCERIGAGSCNRAHTALATMARVYPSSERPSIEPLVRQLEAADVSPYGRQFTRLLIHELLRTRPDPDAAARFAAENHVLMSTGATAWPSGELTPAVECSAPLSWPEAQKRARDRDRSTQPIDACVKDLPIADAEHPPAVSVTLLVAPDGTVSAVEATGVAVSPEVLDCVVTAARRVVEPPAKSGFRVHGLWLRPDAG